MGSHLMQHVMENHHHTTNTSKSPKEELQAQQPQAQVMTRDEVHQWLEQYPIANVSDLEHMSDHEKERMARQIRYECAVYDLAREKQKRTTDVLASLERGSTRSRNYLEKWLDPVTKAIAEEQANIRTRGK